MKFKRILAFLLVSALVLPFASCKNENSGGYGDKFYAGYAEAELVYGDMSDYYIAGYHNGLHPEGVLDPQKVKAFWIDNGETSLMLISVDCIALDGGTVSLIRSALKDFTKKSGCGSVNVISTHTHAGVDTLGLWGDVGINGKNEAFMSQIIEKSVYTAEKAYESRCAGKIYYSSTVTRGMQADSRKPGVCDSNLYQLRFEAENGKNTSVRVVSFAAHAESLRSENRMISADFVASLSDKVYAESGDRLIFLPGAIGGLIMTPVYDGGDLVNNMKITGEKLANYVLSPSEECELAPKIAFSRVEFETKLENTLFLYYKFLGILGSEIKRDAFGNYTVKSEVSMIALGDVTLSLIPGEIFPELVDAPKDSVYGGGLSEIAENYGNKNNIFVGLANDELGYIVPEVDFVLHPDTPYLAEAEGHYEETNSVGKGCGADIAAAYREAAERLEDKMK